MTAQRIYKVSKVNPIVLLIGFAVVMVMLFWIAKSILKALAFLSPAILIAAVIINYRVVIGYGRWLLDVLKRNPAFGILAIVFTFLCFPLVALYLLIRALASKGITTSDSLKKGEYIKYEEVDEDFLDISDVKARKKQIDNDYNDVF